MTGLEAILTGALYFSVASALVLALAAVGELIQERAGVLNLGLEATVIAGALGGFYLAYALDSAYLGYLGGALFAAAVGLLFASLVVGLKLNQVVVGILFVAMALGAADVLWDRLFGAALTPPAVERLPRLAIPLLADIPVLGPALFRRSLPEFGAVVLIGVVGWMLYRTRLGLVFRSVGESPGAVHFSGRHVNAYRALAVVMGSGLAGLSGALLTIDHLGFYAPGVTAGRGWIAIAIVIMGGWRPWTTLLAALVFGVADMLQFQVQAADFRLVPHEFLVAFPYVVAVLALVVRRKSVQPPASLTIPFVATQDR